MRIISGDSEPTAKGLEAQAAETVTRKSISIFFAVALSAAIFCFDASTEYGSAVAILYVPAIALLGNVSGKNGIFIGSLVSAALTCIGFFISHGVSADTDLLMQLTFALLGNALSTAALLKREIERGRLRAFARLLRSSEERYRNMFESSAVAIWEHDLRPLKTALTEISSQLTGDLRHYLWERPTLVENLRSLINVTDVNGTALRLLGVEEKSKFFNRLADFVPPNDDSTIDFLIALAEDQPWFQGQSIIVSRDGQRIPVIVTINLACGQLDKVQANIIDIRERVAIQSKLDASLHELETVSRAAVIGEISASIAHEVNQPLSAVSSFLQAGVRWLTMDPPNVQEARAAVVDTLSAGKNAADVVKRVRMLLGNAKSEFDNLSLDDLILDALDHKRKELEAKKIRYDLQLGCHPNQTRGDRILLKQAFMNLIGNAIHAMDARAGTDHVLKITSQICGEECVVRIADTGLGLGQEPGEVFFKAFKTTKEDGMGLGLPMCRSIVSAHGGRIQIQNRDDTKGAIVELRLPQS